MHSLLKQILLSVNVQETLQLMKILKSQIKQQNSIQYQINRAIQYSFPQNINFTTLKIIDDFYQQNNIPVDAQILHQLAHIEYNAMKAYIDTVYRFSDISPEFIYDFLQVAIEESEHFELCCQALKHFNAIYGSYPLHGNLRDKVIDSQGSLIERIAVVSLCQEGRGLDAGPGLADKVRITGSDKWKIVQKIANDEVRHVKIGLKWFERLSKDPEQEYLDIMRKFGIKLTWKMNIQRREKAGFNEKWMKTFENWKKESNF